DVLMRGCERVVFLDSFLVVRLRIDPALANSFGHLGDAGSPAAEGRSVVNQHCIAPFGDFISPAYAAVVAHLVRYDDWPQPIIDAGDFAPAEEFVPAVIMQSEDCRQAS